MLGQGRKLHGPVGDCKWSPFELKTVIKSKEKNIKLIIQFIVKQLYLVEKSMTS